MQPKITAKASVDHKPLFQSCDNTGKRLTKEELDAGDTTTEFDAIYRGHRDRGGLVAAISFELRP